MKDIFASSLFSLETEMSKRDPFKGAGKTKVVTNSRGTRTYVKQLNGKYLLQGYSGKTPIKRRPK